MSHRLARALTGVATGAAVALACPAAPAAAGPPERETFAHTVQFGSDDFCGTAGLSVVHDLSTRGRIQYGPRGEDRQIYYFNRARVDELITNPSTGDQVRVTSNFIMKDLHVTDNGDGTLTVLLMGTGNETVDDAEGDVLARNPGQVRFELLIDHAGTPTDPSDDVFLAPPALVKGSTGRSDDFCSAVVPALT